MSFASGGRTVRRIDLEIYCEELLRLVCFRRCSTLACSVVLPSSTLAVTHLLVSRQTRLENGSFCTGQLKDWPCVCVCVCVCACVRACVRACFKFNVALRPQRKIRTIRDVEPRTATSTSTQLLIFEMSIATVIIWLSAMFYALLCLTTARWISPRGLSSCIVWYRIVLFRDGIPGGTVRPVIVPLLPLLCAWTESQRILIVDSWHLVIIIYTVVKGQECSFS